MTREDDFAVQYRALRIREGWARADGLEDPTAGDPRLWSGRVQSVAHAARVLAELHSAYQAPLIIDVGAGGAWAARHLPWARVISVDLIPPVLHSGAYVRADMCHLPIRDRAADGVLFAAALHYAPTRQVIDEAARVLRPGGLLVAVDSPVYSSEAEAAKAIRRSQAYYRRSGFPELASNYHPINAVELRRALDEAGFGVELWKGEPSLFDRVKRRFGGAYATIVVARLT